MVLVSRKYLISCRDLVPLGQTKSNFNFNLDEKRVLNFENEVSDSDNIKQDMSIDVYGRKDEEEAAPTPTPTPPPPPQVTSATRLVPAYHLGRNA